VRACVYTYYIYILYVYKYVNMYIYVYNLQLSYCEVTTNQPGKADRTLHFTIPHSFVIPTAA
jgi:uncharacterized membrane protein